MFNPKLLYHIVLTSLLLSTGCAIDASVAPESLDQGSPEEPDVPPSPGDLDSGAEPGGVATPDMGEPVACQDERCDGLDNDCDGVVDEQLPCPCSDDGACYGGPIETRGVGACQDGSRECHPNGEAWLSCEGWTPPIDELCDMIDNDCDGETDEGVSNACGDCGEVPEEVCDELDNDCDGRTDEGVSNACGACGEVPEEVCDNQDNDCDNSIDEGVTNVCGACGEVPSEVCDERDNDCDGEVDEGVTNACGLCGPLPVDVCDFIDNDCDGAVDEEGANACGGCGPVPDEVCDSQDNDCDGEVDEGVTNACGACGDVPVEICDYSDNDCDGRTDEGLTNACGACGRVPNEVCDGRDNDCDGETDEGVLNACGACGSVPTEVCDYTDNDCDGRTDEGELNDCGACGPEPTEVCDLIDNDCDGTVDEQGCVVADIDIDDDCVTVSCPPEAPHPIACEINFEGDDPRGCVAHRAGESTVYLQEGNNCGRGRVVGSLTCSNIQGDDLDATNCPINKRDTFYPNRPRGCPDTN